MFVISDFLSCCPRWHPEEDFPQNNANVEEANNHNKGGEKGKKIFRVDTSINIKSGKATDQTTIAEKGARAVETTNSMDDEGFKTIEDRYLLAV